MLVFHGFNHKDRLCLPSERWLLPLFFAQSASSIDQCMAPNGMLSQGGWEAILTPQCYLVVLDHFHYEEGRDLPSLEWKLILNTALRFDTN